MDGWTDGTEREREKQEREGGMDGKVDGWMDMEIDGWKDG